MFGDLNQDNLEQSFMSGVSQFGVQSFSPGGAVHKSKKNQQSTFPRDELSNQKSNSKNFNEQWAAMDGAAAISDLNSTNINALTPILSTPAEFQRDPRHIKYPLASKQTSLTKGLGERVPFGGDYHFTKK